MSKLDRHPWTPTQLMTWERSMREEFKEWEAKKDCVEARCEEKIRIVESHQDSLRFWERALEDKENDLDERESAVMARELDLSSKEEQLYSEAYQFRQEYRCDHKVRL